MLISRNNIGVHRKKGRRSQPKRERTMNVNLSASDCVHPTFLTTPQQEEQHCSKFLLWLKQQTHGTKSPGRLR